MDALLGQEVKLRRGESGRYLGEIELLARVYGQSGAESPKEAQPPGRGGPGGWFGGEQTSLLLAVFSVRPEVAETSAESQ